jgi:hypothetical protein
MYNAAISELYLFQISGLWGASSPLHTHLSSNYITNEAESSNHCCRTGVQGGCVTFNSNTQCASDNYSMQPNKEQREREGEYLPPMTNLLIRNGSLNIGHYTEKNICRQLI